MKRLWADNTKPNGTRAHNKGVAGTEKEAAELLRKGFATAPSSGNGDYCYYSPLRGLIWLFPDNTWFGERISPGQSLGEYLKTIPEIEIEDLEFRIVQTEGGISNNLGAMSGVQLTAYLGTRVDDNAKLATQLSELAKKESITIEYEGSLGKTVSVEIRRAIFKPGAPPSNDGQPQKGDTFTNGWTVDYISDDMVWLVGRAEGMPLVNLAPTKQPGIWKLVGLKSTGDQGEEE
jgi:hypothetical protein